MKNILYIIVILLVATAISAGTYALVENSSTSTSMQGGTPPNMTSADGEMSARPEGGTREGGEHGASFAGGMMGVLTILAKVAGITAIVVLLEKAFTLFQKPQASQLSG
jgi:hypothetical protein